MLTSTAKTGLEGGDVLLTSAFEGPEEPAMNSRAHEDPTEDLEDLAAHRMPRATGVYSVQSLLVPVAEVLAALEGHD